MQASTSNKREWIDKYGVVVASRDAKTSEILSVRCRFCEFCGKEDEKKVMKYYRDLKEWRLSLEKITELSEKCDDFHKENY